MDIEPFLLDQWLAKYQFASPPIRYDLAASTGPKWTVGDVLALAGDEARDALERIVLSYTPANGSIELRTRIAKVHGIDPESVVVTTGASEALSALFHVMADSGSNLVLPFPVFPAIPVLARTWGYRVKSYALSRDDAFAHRADQILRCVDDHTKLAFVNSPHNPTGAVMVADELAFLAERLAERNVLLVVDEVYHPLYFGAHAITAARLPNTVVIGDLSKAFSLSGLRIGWVIEPDAARRRQLIDTRGYFSICNAAVTEYLATVALSHGAQLLERLSTVARANLAALDDFMRTNSDVISWARPADGTTAFPWMNDGSDTRPFCETLAASGVLTAPGNCFDSANHFRIGFGAQAEGFGDALAIATDVLQRRQWRSHVA